MINRFPHIQVRNEKQGFKELLRWAKAQGVNTKDALFGLEFTGYYSDALELFLTGKAICEVCGRSTIGTLIRHKCTMAGQAFTAMPSNSSSSR